ncbi:MAG: transcriptional regulator MerR family [Eubacterium sp.]|nr:transcriptional regulator MerR family [Eubacterium sp.]
MNYLTAAEFSKKWDVSSRMIAYYCETGRIDGATKKGKLWLIPAHTEKPADKRYLRNKIVIQDNHELQGEFQRINRMDTDNYTMVYRANDLYKNLGLTRETLRYYEEIGLIVPERNPSSQYREFTFSDISHLMSIDFYKKRGFTPLEILELMQSGKQPDTMYYLNSKIEYLEETIRAQQRMVKHLNDTKQFYEYAISSKGEFSVREFPLYLVRESFDSVSSLKEYQNRVLNYLDLQQEDILSNLVRAVTFDSTGYKGTGMCIVRRAVDKGRQVGNMYLESGRCLHTVLEADSHDDSIMEDMFFSCHEWAKANNEEFKGTVYIFIRFVELSGQTERNFYEVWLPLI